MKNFKTVTTVLESPGWRYSRTLPHPEQTTTVFPCIPFPVTAFATSQPQVFQLVSKGAGDKKKGSLVTGNICKQIWWEFRIPTKFDLLVVSLCFPK